MNKNIDKTGLITQLDLFSKSKTELLIQISQHLRQSAGHTKSGSKLLTIATPNPEMVVQAMGDESFAQLLHQFTIRIPDGAGLVYAARLLESASVGMQRIAGVEVVAALLSQEELSSGSVLLVGGRGYANERYQQWVVCDATDLKDSKMQKSDGEKILWWHSGFLERADQTPEEQHALRVVVERLKPQIVFVALGAPAQEHWLMRNREWLEHAGVKVGMVVGGAFDMLLGKIPRAPMAVRQLGLEWLYRLYQEPWRWRRQLRLIHFIYIVGWEWMRQHWARLRK